jgi:hypothetical protein
LWDFCETEKYEISSASDSNEERKKERKEGGRKEKKERLQGYADL